MRREDLEQRIHDFFHKEYEASYNGRMEITQEGSIYSFLLGVPSYMAPTHISMETESDEDFMKFLEQELKSRNYVRVHFYRIKKIEKDGKGL